MNYYDSIAQSYDELHFEEQKRKALRVLSEISISKTDTLLDVGCGTGKITKLFPCNITGIDPSKELLKFADFPVVQGFAEILPFKDKSFDIVISLTAIHNFTDYKKAIQEIKRVAKRTIIISVLKKAKEFNNICKEIKKELNVVKELDDLHDIIFICKYICST